MRPTDRELERLGPFPYGANNLAPETSVPSRALREAVNVKLSDDGKISRREGYQLIEPLEGATSVVGVGTRGFVNAGTDLYAFEVIDRTVAALTPIHSGLRPGAKLTAVLIEPDLFLSDGEENLRIAPDNTISPWAVPQASPPGVAAILTGGGMQPGRYRLALTCRMPTGEEGPASEPLELELQQGEYPQISLPPAPVGVSRYALYMTKPNGTELLLVGVVPVNAVNVSVSSPRLGRPCPSEFLYPMPPADFALYFRSRLWVAKGAVLTASEPFQYGLCQPDFSSMPFSEDITGLGAAGESGGGFFVGQKSKVYYVRGDSPESLTLAEKYPAGMVAGTLTSVPGARLPMEAPPSEPVPIWLATNGVICVGLPDGTVLPLTETRFAASVGETGAGLFLQRAGSSRFVATTSEPRDNVFAVKDEAIFEVVRNGIPQVI